MKKLSLKLIGLSLIIVLAGCNKAQEIDKPMAKDITDMAELGVVEYTVTKNIKANDNQAFYKFGDRKILFSCKAIMKAGIDMKDFSREDVEVNDIDNSVVVTLPKAKILSLNLPPEEAKVVYEKVGTFRGKFSATDRTALLQQGEKAILESVDEIGILKEAEADAILFIKAFFSQAGYNNITVNFK